MFFNLLKTSNYYYVISDTTRKPRINNGVLERKGEEYWFKSEKEWVESARKILKENPEILAQILNYDVRKGSFGKYFK